MWTPRCSLRPSPRGLRSDRAARARVDDGWHRRRAGAVDVVDAVRARRLLRFGDEAHRRLLARSETARELVMHPSILGAADRVLAHASLATCRGCARRRTSTCRSQSRWRARSTRISNGSRATPGAPMHWGTWTTCGTRSKCSALAPVASASGTRERITSIGRERLPSKISASDDVHRSPPKAKRSWPTAVSLVLGKMLRSSSVLPWPWTS